MKIMILLVVLNINILYSQTLVQTINGKYLVPYYDVDNDGINELINFRLYNHIEIYDGATYQLRYTVDIPGYSLFSGYMPSNPFFDFDGDNQVDLLGLNQSDNGPGYSEGFQIRRISDNSILFEYTDSDAVSAEQSFAQVFRTELDGVNSYFIVALQMFDENVDVAYKTLIFSDPSSTAVTSDFYLPSKIKLNQNFPNPFNPVTNIPYQINKSGHILLNIYDVNGRLIETLVNKYQEVGSYSSVWNPKQLSSGPYFYLIEIDGQITTAKKAIFLK
nr:T9SS type A sorting domain-containing protein [Bacteroidota bacterium]